MLRRREKTEGEIIIGRVLTIHLQRKHFPVFVFIISRKTRMKRDIAQSFTFLKEYERIIDFV